MPMQAQRGDGGVAATHSKPGVRRKWVISTIFRPHCPLERDPVPIVQEALWASALVWTGTEKPTPLGFDLRTVQPVASRCSGPSIDRI